MKNATFSWIFFALFLLPQVAIGQFLEYEFGAIFKDSSPSFHLSLRGISIDAEDNVYVYGHFNDTLTYDGIVLIAEDNDQNPTDYFFAKFTNEGELIWMKQFPQSYTFSLFKVDDAGNSYFGQDINFQYANRLVKYDTNGNLMWERVVPDRHDANFTFDQFGVSKQGESYAFGYHKNEQELEGITYLAPKDYNGLLIRYVEDGSINQVIQFNSDDEFTCIGLESDDNGSVFVMVTQDGSLSINGTTFNKSLNNKEIAVYKLNEAGEVLWKRAIYGTTESAVFPLWNRLHYNAYNNNLLLIPRFFAVNNEILGVDYSSTIMDNKFCLMISLDEIGETNWVYQFESNEPEGTFIPLSLSTNNKGEIYLSSQHVKGIQFGEYIETSGILGPENNQGTAIMKFSPSGTPLCLQEINDGIYNFLRDVAIDGKGNLWLGGLLSGQLATQSGLVDGMGYISDDEGIIHSALLLKTKDISFPHCEYSIDPDTFLCKNQGLELDALLTDQTYLWSNGDETQTTVVNGPDTYQMLSYDEHCIYHDTVTIEEKICSCDLDFPNAFTPNGDGNNDVFTHIGDCEITDYHLRIFNRFGQKIFESRDQNQGWNGENATADVYIWRLEISAKEIDFVFNESFQGDVTLIR